MMRLPATVAALLFSASAALRASPPYTQYAFVHDCSEPDFSQVFSLTAVPGALAQAALTVNDNVTLCATAANASIPGSGGLSLSFAPCAAGGSPAQACSLTAGALTCGGAAAAPAATYWGAPITLTPGGGGGGTWALTAGGRLVHAASGLCLDAGPLPNAHGCLELSVRGLPFCNASLDVAARVTDLLSRLTLSEKIGLTGSGPFSDDCDCTDAGVPRLGVPEHMWLVETNSMIASQCYGGSCATAFPSAMNLAASFNSSVWSRKGEIMGDEMRALNNLAWHRADTQSGTRIGLNGFGPDINQPRDPRNGRAGELAGEDPLLIGAYAAAMLRGMQEDAADAAHLKMSAGVKHFAMYSMETGRMTSTGDVSLFDLWDTYLRPYEAAFVDGRAQGSMCSYISLGISATGTAGSAPYIPACGNSYLLQTVVREYWGRPDAMHTSDCGAVKYMAQPRAPAGRPYAANLSAAAADALNGGMDLNTETTLPQQLAAALAAGLTSEAALDAALSRTLAVRLRLGLLDPLEGQPLTRRAALGAATVGAPAHVAAALDGAAQGLVLVKNEAGALPLRAGARLAVLGPLAAADQALLGDYYADEVCPFAADNQRGSYACVPTIAASLQRLAGAVATFPGVTVAGNDSSWGAALAAAADPLTDAVVLCLGADGSVGAEGTDVKDIGLPGLQSAFGLAVLAAAGAKPVILLLVSPFPTAFDELAAPVAATVLAYTPGFGAPALAAALFGANRWGRAVQSVYPRAYQDAVGLADFGMAPRAQPAPNPGRSYRYYGGAAGPLLVRFGQGLSYNSLALACAAAPLDGAAELALSCNLTSASGPDGEQVLQFYHRAGGDIIGRIAGAHPVPLSTLVGFARVALPAGATVPVQLRLPAARALALVDGTGASVLYPGLHYIDCWDGGSNNVTLAVQAPDEAGGAPRIVKRPPLPPA